MSKYLLISINLSIHLISSTTLYAQQFKNSGLEGEITGLSSLPPGWSNVAYTDAACRASTVPAATPDLTSPTQPDPSKGIIGNSFSGKTFISGLYGSVFGGNIFHEGILQEVSGFIIGCPYEINFYQAVVKQGQTNQPFSHAYDTSGSWAVYLNNSLIYVSNPTVSHQASNSTSFNWEQRSISFIADTNSYIIKFLPEDDDAMLSFGTSRSGALRMGIDSIYIIAPNLPDSLTLGSDTTVCPNDSLLLDVSQPNVSYIWQDSSTQGTFLITESGTYFVTIEGSQCGRFSDTIKISYWQDTVGKLLPEDTLLCEGDTISLDISQPFYNSYEWQDLSTNSNYQITKPGTYSVAVVSACGDAGMDTLHVAGCPDDSEQICTMFIPNSFSPNGDSKNDEFSPISNCTPSSYAMKIYNRLGAEIFSTIDFDEAWSITSSLSKAYGNDAYIYSISYIFPTKEKNIEHKTGMVTLLR